MNLYQGIFNTSNYKPGERPTSFGGVIWEKNPMAAPLLGMLAQAGPSQVMAAPVHKWAIKRYFNVRPKVTANAPAGVKGSATNVSVDTTAGIRQGDLFLVTATNEQVRVQAVVSGTQVSLRRAFYQGGSSAIPAGTELLWVGNAVEEASMRPMASGGPNTYGGYMFNFSQIFRHAHAVSGTVASTMLMSLNQQGYGMPMLESKNVLIGGKEEAAYAHAAAKERALLFSQPHEDTQNGFPIRTMGGIFWMLNTYAPANVVTLANGTLSFKQMSKLLYNSVKHNYEGRPDAKSRIILAGRRARMVIDEMLQAQFDKPLLPMTTNGTYGVKYQNFETFDGSFKVMEHPIFDAFPALQGTALVVDLNSMGVHYLPGRNAAYRGWGHMADGTQQDPGAAGSAAGELQASEMGIDARGGDYLSEMTASLGTPDSFMVIRNICQPGLDPALSVVANKTICIEMDKPCQYGAVDPYTTVHLIFSGGNAGQEVKINYPAHTQQDGTVVPAGSATITLDGNGNGVYAYEVGGAGAFTLCVEPNAALANSAGVTFPGLEYTACVKVCMPTNDHDIGAISSSEAAANC